MFTERRSLLWLRTGCVVVSAAALLFIVRRINLHSLVQTVRSMQAIWFLLATALYGALFLPASARWHLTLRLTSTDVNFGVTTRFSYIGHFFYTILLGAAGGDVAKSALYAQWYRFDISKVLTAASLDRLLGFGGLILFGAAAIAFSAASGGSNTIRSMAWRWPGIWLFVAIATVAIAIFSMKRYGKDTAGARFARTFSENCRRLAAAPGIFIPGLCYSFLVQLALSGTLALNLRAVSSTPLDWARLMWTLPVISVVSALPITLAGMGARDGAALALLGLCGVSGATAVASSMLTAGVSLFWAAFSGILFWRELGEHRTSEEAEPAELRVFGKMKS